MVDDIPRGGARRRRLLIVGLVAALGLLGFVGLTLWRLHERFNLRPRAPVSDVPLTTELGFWARAEPPRIERFEVTVLDAPLHLVNSRALVGFRLRGTMTGRPGWRPVIGAVHLTQRPGPARPGDHQPQDTRRPVRGDILLMPIVESVGDDTYRGAPVPFDVRVEDLVNTMGWGRNHYTARAGDIAVDFVLLQGK